MKNLSLCIAFIVSFTSFSQIPSDGLIAHYPFSGNANDLSGKNYNGIVNGASLTEDRFGNAESAYKFDGINDYIDLSNYVSTFNSLDKITISFWVKTEIDNQGSTNFSSTPFSLSEGGTGANTSCIFIGNNSTGTLDDEIAIASHQRNTEEKYITGLTTSKRKKLLDNQWHHLVFEYNNMSTLIYIDKKLVDMDCEYGVNNGQFGKIENASKLFIGTRWANGEKGAFMNGELDDFRIYNKTLNKKEIKELFNEENPRSTNKKK